MDEQARAGIYRCSKVDIIEAMMSRMQKENCLAITSQYGVYHGGYAEFTILRIAHGLVDGWSLDGMNARLIFRVERTETKNHFSR